MNVEEAIRTAAAAGPAYSADLAAIQRRGRRYAHRRTAAKAGAATAALGVGSAFVIGMPHHSGPSISATPSATASRSAAPSPSVEPSAVAARPWTSDQRIVIGGLSGWMIDDVDIETGAAYSQLMRPDGKIVSHRFGVDKYSFIDQFVPLPDGRFVVLRTVNVGAPAKPDPDHPDGPSNPSIHSRLQIVDSKEKVRLSHEVRRTGEYVQLLAATAECAYLVRPEGVVRHDFATSHETLVLSKRVLGMDLSEGLPWMQANLEGDQLAMIKGEPGRAWSVDVYDLSTGTQRLSYPLSGVAAAFAGPLRLSPDALRVAVFYRTATDSRLAVLDLASQALVLDQTMVDSKDRYATMRRTDTDERLRGVAWSDDRTLRIAWAQLPADPHGKYIFDKITVLRTIAVG